MFMNTAGKVEIQAIPSPFHAMCSTLWREGKLRDKYLQLCWLQNERDKGMTRLIVQGKKVVEIR